MKIIYLVENKFTNRDYYRFGLNELIINLDKKVDVLDFSKMLYPEVTFDYINHSVKIYKNFNHIKIKNLQDLKYYIENNEIEYAITLLVFSFKTLKIFKNLSKNKIKYYSTGQGTIGIQPYFNYRLINTNSIIQKAYNLSLRRILSTIKKYFLKILIAFNGIRYYDVFFMSGGLKTDVDNILVNSKTKKEIFFSNNYQLHLLQYMNYKKNLENDYDVYIDQNLCSSSDSKLRGNNLKIDSKRFYKELNILFEKIERVTGRNVIISAHPKANVRELKTYNPGRTIITNTNSGSLIYFANNIITSYSMAMQFAIIYNKNLILFTNYDIMKYKKSITDSISKYLNIKYLNISNDYNVCDFLDNTKSKYKSYLEDFIFFRKKYDENRLSLFMDKTINNLIA